MKKVSKIIFEYESGEKEEITGKHALLFQSRINSSGIMAGIGVDAPIIPKKIEEK